MPEAEGGPEGKKGNGRVVFLCCMTGSHESRRGFSREEGGLGRAIVTVTLKNFVIVARLVVQAAGEGGTGGKREVRREQGDLWGPEKYASCESLRCRLTGAAVRLRRTEGGPHRKRKDISDRRKFGGAAHTTIQGQKGLEKRGVLIEGRRGGYNHGVIGAFSFKRVSSAQVRFCWFLHQR